MIAAIGFFYIKIYMEIFYLAISVAMLLSHGSLVVAKYCSFNVQHLMKFFEIHYLKRIKAQTILFQILFS